MVRTELIIEVRGGVVCGVLSNNPDVEVAVWDWDDKEDDERTQEEKERDYDAITSDLLQIY